MTMPHAPRRPALQTACRSAWVVWTPWACGPAVGGPCWSQSGRPRQARSKLHLLTDAAGLPLAVTVTAANTPDGALLAAMVDDVPALRMPSGRRRKLPAKLHAGKAYDSAPIVERCGTEGSGHASPGTGLSPPSGLAATAGRSSAPCRGWVAGDGCRCGGTGTPGRFRLRVGGLCHRLLQPAVSSHRNDTPPSSYSCC